MKRHVDQQTSSVTISAVRGDDTDTAIFRLELPLTRELKTFLRPHHLRMCERFYRFKLDGQSHVQAHLGWTRGDDVKACIAQVARTIRFMDVTGLAPTCEEIYGYKTFSPQQRLPGQDHATRWRDPSTNAIVMLDEPYGYVDTLFEDRRSWAARHGLAVRRLGYRGTYRPGCGIVCDLVYRVEEREFAQNVTNWVEKLDSLPEIQDSAEANLDV